MTASVAARLPASTLPLVETARFPAIMWSEVKSSLPSPPDHFVLLCSTCVWLWCRKVWSQLWAKGSEVAKPGGTFSAVYIVLAGGFSEAVVASAPAEEEGADQGSSATEAAEPAAAKPVRCPAGPLLEVRHGGEGTDSFLTPLSPP